MSEVVDLDKLVPEPKKIKLNGRIIDLYPGKLKTIIKLQRAFTALQKGDIQMMDKVIDALAELIPAIKDDDMDISLPTLGALVQLAYESSLPPGSSNTKDASMTPITEKKGGDLKKPSPTSSEDTPPTG